MKFGIDKVMLLGCLGLWGGMLAESSLRTGDPRCFDGSCKPSGPKLQLPASIDTDPRSRSFEALQETNQSNRSNQSESNGPNPDNPDFQTSDPLGALNTQGDEDFVPHRLIQQDTRLPGGANRARDGRFASSRARQRSQYATLRAFREAMGEHWKSTVQIFGQNQQIALGAIARPEGWIVSKSSEIPDSSIEVRLHDGTKIPGTVKVRRPELDLVLIKVERQDLPAIQWNTDTKVALGGWIASADSRSLPLALGVVSVEKRTIQQQRALLGIQLSSAHQGPLVENVVVGSGAYRAGILQGDIIIKIEGKPVETRQEVLNYLMTLTAGKRLTIDVNRDSKAISFEAQMMDLTNIMLDPTELQVNGSVSARSTGFREVIEHDSVLEPQHCGGPIVDVDGNAIGLNIARAGRVSCYALMAKTVSKAVEEMLQTASTLQEQTVGQQQAPSASDDTTGLESSEVGSGLKIEALKPPTSISPVP
ncbi:MAG: PDZ domain-containing protein [Planctomycetota bacterium]|nr:PDZ domain-containing protein [Planctomycetota bacterium]